MQIIADLQIHSRHSRAVSKEMVLPKIADWARKKGISLMATGDWMHPVWMSELRAGLTEWSEGIYASRENPEGAKFLLSAEISSIFTQGGKGRRIHTLVFSPSIKTCLKINEELRRRGCNLSSDGRPIVGLSLIELSEVVFTVDERCLVIPAHVWTPWFGLYGSKSGFDSLEEAFAEFADRIYAVETGLSSDPAMNWGIKELENRAIVSFSDAHSGPKIGREATVFEKSGIGKSKKFTYNDIYWAIAERFLGNNQGELEIGYTIEFFPEEGKYHYTGHRKCGVVQSPSQTRERGTTCHVCGKSLTVGVVHRVDEIAFDNIEPLVKAGKSGVTGYFHPKDKTRPGYVMLVPLKEILSEVLNIGVASKKVLNEYNNMIERFEGEFGVLMNAKLDELRKTGGQRLAEAIKKVRNGSIVIKPGYDGVFGEIDIWGEDELKERDKQMALF